MIFRFDDGAELLSDFAIEDDEFIISTSTTGNHDHDTNIPPTPQSMAIPQTPQPMAIPPATDVESLRSQLMWKTPVATTFPPIT